MILKDLFKMEQEKTEDTEEDKKKREDIQKQFDVVMNYDIEDAIKSKRGDKEWM
jgi:hypothetical protein